MSKCSALQSGYLGVSILPHICRLCYDPVPTLKATIGRVLLSSSRSCIKGVVDPVDPPNEPYVTSLLVFYFKYRKPARSRSVHIIDLLLTIDLFLSPIIPHSIHPINQFIHHSQPK